MTVNRNIVLCVVFHHSEMRTRGYEMAKEFYTSWESLKVKPKLIILDNESNCDFDFIDTTECNFIRIDDQVSFGGITSAWNLLCKEAVKSGAEVIMGFNDDIILNDSIMTLAERTVDDNTVYVPITNGMHPAWPHQKSDGIKKDFVKNIDSVNGFFLSFTSNFWIQKSIDGDLFVRTKFKDGYGITDWEGQELMLRVWKPKFGTSAKIIGDCWIFHHKLRSWKNAKNRYINNKL